MNGKYLILIFTAFLTIFTLFLFYFQNFAYYERLETKQELSIANKIVQVIHYTGIDSRSSGLKLRECFKIKKLNSKEFTFDFIFIT